MFGKHLEAFGPQGDSDSMSAMRMAMAAFMIVRATPRDTRRQYIGGRKSKNQNKQKQYSKSHLVLLSATRKLRVLRAMD